jgi:hypothetical protein
MLLPLTLTCVATFLGDSITNGYAPYLERPAAAVSFPGWPAFRILAERKHLRALWKRPEAVVVLLGTNDLSTHHRPAWAARDVYQTAVHLAVIGGARVLVSTVPELRGDRSEPEAVDAALRYLFRPWPWLSVVPLGGEVPRSGMPDRVHPNVTWSKWMAAQAQALGCP